jgi:exopolyphosphatase/guanosine-5'-triphosphate,3'-diphosphate pyrophosphatase
VWGRHHVGRMVGVIDVGSNTVRLVVAHGGRQVLSEREMLHLGADVELHGAIPAAKLEATARLVGSYAADARAAGAIELDVLITSPGRQAANGDELLAALASATGCPTRILSAAEEAQLGFIGAVAVAAPPARRRVAVIDVGGGSAQVVVGTRRDGPEWLRSIDLGSQRLTSRLLRSNPPGEAAIGAARAEAAGYLHDFEPPEPRLALAVGGSARALKRIAGSRLGSDELEEALALLAVTPAAEIVERFGIDADRVDTLAGGAAILTELQARLATPLKVVRGGVREGALLELEERRAAA